MDITQKLDQLAEYMSQRDAIGIRKQELIDSILPPEIKAKLAEIDVEFMAQSAAVFENIETLTAEIKSDILTFGASAKGAHLQAVWNKGRVSWDTKALDAVVALHPELAQFRKEGEPSVTIRKI